MRRRAGFDARLRDKNMVCRAFEYAALRGMNTEYSVGALRGAKPAIVAVSSLPLMSHASVFRRGKEYHHENEV